MILEYHFNIKKYIYIYNSYGNFYYILNDLLEKKLTDLL